MDSPAVSVIVRARDEAPSIGRCLGLVGAQAGVGRPEVVVVDNGSRDGTAEIAAAAGARVVELAREEFTFGRALNIGASVATGEVLVALSAHAFPVEAGWLRRVVRTLEDPGVACASGDAYGPDGQALTGPVRQDLALARRRPEWGYSNAAGGFRAALWRERGFREDLPGSEDREWSWYWLARGMECVIDPALVVRHDHTHDPLREIFRRARREAEGLALAGAPLPSGPGALAREWWSDLRWYDSPARARLSHRRAARLLGSYAGRMAAGRRVA